MITTLILRFFIKKIRKHGDSKDIDALQFCDDLLMILSAFLIGRNEKDWIGWDPIIMYLHIYDIDAI